MTVLTTVIIVLKLQELVFYMTEKRHLKSTEGVAQINNLRLFVHSRFLCTLEGGETVSCDWKGGRLSHVTGRKGDYLR